MMSPMQLPSSTPKTAMVLAAGLGTRMRPLTDHQPKPLISVSGTALIDYTLDRFARAGVNHAVVNVHYLADQIEGHVKTRSAPRITISDERAELLETGGGLKKAAHHFDDAPIFCTNTDAILVDGPGAEPCERLAQAWDSAKMDMLLLLSPIEATSGYDGQGDFIHACADDTAGPIAFRQADYAPYVFTGLQILNSALLKDAPDGPFSTAMLWRQAAEARTPIRRCP